MKHICKNCKYFKEDTKYTTCKNEKINYIQSSHEFDKTSDRANYIDYDNYDVEFYVGENFGCIHWQKGGNNEIN